MPVDRFLHPRLGHSEKAASLTDLEYRVWTQYILSSDDFGVMRAEAVKLQADNDALMARKPAIVQRAFDRVIGVGLLRTFIHQGRRFVYQHNWQEYQKVEYPRDTQNPKPPDDALAACDESTRELFGLHPGGKIGKLAKRQRNESGTGREPVGNDLENESQTDPAYARARPPETAKAKANGLRQEANGSRPVPSIARHREHMNHVACGIACVPAFLHDEFVRALNRPADQREAAAEELFKGYRAHMDAWEATGDPVGDVNKFWRAWFAATYPGPKARDVAAASERKRQAEFFASQV